MATRSRRQHDHCTGYRAVAVAPRRDLITLKIDAEPHEPLPPDGAGAIALDEELVRLTRLVTEKGAVCCDRVLFCAKETVYKAWFPLTHHRLGFQEPTSPLTPDDRPYRRLLLCSSAGGRTDDRRRTAHRVRRLLADH